MIRLFAPAFNVGGAVLMANGGGGAGGGSNNTPGNPGFDPLRSHEKVVRERGGTKESVQDAVRIAAVIHAVALTLATA